MGARAILFVAVALSLAAAACGSVAGSSTGTGSSSASGAGGAGGAGGATSSTASAGGSTPGPAPTNHRASAEACAAPRPATDPDTGFGACHKDAECTEGSNGRCASRLGQPQFCSYDACAKDADCGSARICDCRNPTQLGANTCVHGNCQVDADCDAGGYCSPSALNVAPECALSVQPGSFGYFCHTAADECVNDADCPSSMGEPACLFQVDKVRWACQPLQCSD